MIQDTLSTASTNSSIFNPTTLVVLAVIAVVALAVKITFFPSEDSQGSLVIPPHGGQVTVTGDETELEYEFGPEDGVEETYVEREI